MTPGTPFRVGTELLVIGGGATGLGVAYDAALRGFKVLLAEKGDLANGASGRYHGLLHSGGRYALSDPQSARDCARENAVLRRLLPETIEDCGGLFVTTPADPPDYADRWASACKETGVRAEEFPASAALTEEPLLNPGISRVFHVPDAGCDSFDLCHAVARAAQDWGAQIWIRHKVVRLLVEAGRVVGGEFEDLRTGELKRVKADMVINCAGAWAGRVAALAGCEVRVTAGKGIMIAMNSRLVNRVVNRLHPPGDGDILVPVGTVSIIGTTDTAVLDPDRYDIEPWEVKAMLDEGEVLAPTFRHYRALRVWAGVRPLFDPPDMSPTVPPAPTAGACPGGQATPPRPDPASTGEAETSRAESRALTRAHAILDHAERDGVEGIVTVVGGKLTTFRLMAEEALDAACMKLKVERECRTQTEPIRPPGAGRKHHRLGQRLEEQEHAAEAAGVICECELVTRQQIDASLKGSKSPVLNDLRRDLRLGMGPCQGGFCIFRAAGILHEHIESEWNSSTAPPRANSALVEYLQERWKGIRPLMWGQSMRQMELDLRLYRETLGVERLPLSRAPETYPTELTA